jgi:hypothetical protein
MANAKGGKLMAALPELLKLIEEYLDEKEQEAESEETEE